MNKQLFIIPLLLLSSCRTAADPTASSLKMSATPAKTEVLLQKIVGRLPEDKGKAQIFDCQVLSSDLANAIKVKAWIDDVEKVGLNEAYLFRAADPSVEIFGFKGDKKILIFEYASTRKYPKPNDSSGLKNIAAEGLMKIVDEKCPTPSK